MQLIYLETWLGAGDTDKRPLAVFEVALSDDVSIKWLRLWQIGDKFKVRCGPEHQVEMSADLRAKILKMALAEYKRRERAVSASGDRNSVVQPSENPEI